MPVLDASALTSDPEGIELLRDVLGTAAEGSAQERRFPLEAWTPKAPAGAVADGSGFPAVAPAPEQIEPRFADAAA